MYVFNRRVFSWNKRSDGLQVFLRALYLFNNDLLEYHNIERLSNCTLFFKK
jgi:hypothetical protein